MVTQRQIEQTITRYQDTLKVTRGVVSSCDANLALGVTELAGVNLVEERDNATRSIQSLERGITTLHQQLQETPF